MFYKQCKNRKGFTLIEIIVAIAIIAVLSTIGVVSISSALNTSGKKAASTFLSSTWSTTATYFLQASSGFTSDTTISRATLNKTFNDGRVYALSETALNTTSNSLTNGKVYIQYQVNTSSIQKYTIVKITYKYKNKYYSTINGGTTVTVS